MPTSPINESLLDDKLASLEQARPWSPRAVSRLETLIRTGEDDALFRINPIRYALDRNLSENEGIDLFLYSAKFGLFEMDWHLVCPVCGHIVESLSELSGVKGHIHCAYCQLVADITLDDYIQVTFTISRNVRFIKYHDPRSLSVEDLYYKYMYCQDLKPAHGMAHQDILRMITRLLSNVSPQGKTALELEPGGLLIAKGLIDKGAFVAFLHQQETPADSLRVNLRLKEGKFHTEDLATPPVDVDYGIAQFQYQALGQLPQAKVVVELENHTDDHSPMCIVQYPPGFGPEFLELEPSLSGKRLLTNQTFRNLFRTETVEQGEGIGIKDITFLFTDLKSSTAMYDQIGDPKAYYLVRQHFEILTDAIAQNNGSIVKTIGDAVMATFMTPADALRSAKTMIQNLDSFNSSSSQALYLKIGIHRGHSIAVTLNERLDYFGQTVNIAARVQGLADASEIYVTQDAFTAPGVSELLQDSVCDMQEVEVKGVSGRLVVHRITLSA